ncbi:hypothetical protein MIS46_10540 [Wielerella bovis]|uniref:hypothetical protein n=1 Tax=Wielerella bovis TaxID=2917790 RepID=UPI0020184A88|nr:hypothetical protein [Wielerella bovis]ULJ62376.1 hypothetical protein MIS46_10540 [Wielerella bovis]
MTHQSKIDLNVRIDRLVESQNYRLGLMLIENGKMGKFETYICQTLAEVFEKIAKFEAQNLTLFENAIDYQKTDWRELARQNKAKKAA